MSPPESASDIRTLARGGLVNFGGAAAYGLFSFAFAVVVARGLGAGGAGVFFEAIALFTIATTTAQLGADSGVVRWLARYHALGRTADVRRTLGAALVPVAAVGTVLGVGILVFAGEISRLIVHGADEDAAVPYLLVLALFLPFVATARVMLSATRGLGTMIPFVAVENVGKGGLRLLLVLAVVGAGLGKVALALTWAIPIALGFVAAAWWLAVVLRRAESPVRPLAEPARPLRELAREFWLFTAPRGVASFFSVTILWFDIILVGALASAHAAGIYTAATRYVVVGAIALQAVVLVVGPQVSALFARGRTDRVEAVYRTSTCWLTVLGWPVYLTAAVFAPLFLGVFGAEFRAGEAALVILSLAALVNMATGPVTVILLMDGKSSWNLGNTVAALTLNIMLNVLLIPRYGATGAAVALAASVLVANLLPLVQVWLALRLHPFGRGLAVAALASILCFGLLGLAVRLAFGPSAPVFAAFVAVAVSAYAALLWRYRRPLELPAIRSALRVRAA